MIRPGFSVRPLGNKNKNRSKPNNDKPHSNNSFSFNFDFHDYENSSNYFSFNQDLSLDEIISSNEFQNIETDLVKNVTAVNKNADIDDPENIVFRMMNPNIQHQSNLIITCLMHQTHQNQSVINFRNCKSLIPWMNKC